MSEIFALPEGTIIVCSNPNCREYIGRLKRGVRAGIKIKDALEGPGVRYGERPICTTCGHAWYIDEPGNVSNRYLTRIHTKLGWFPDETRIAKNE